MFFRPPKFAVVVDIIGPFGLFVGVTSSEESDDIPEDELFYAALIFVFRLLTSLCIIELPPRSFFTILGLDDSSKLNDRL